MFQTNLLWQNDPKWAGYPLGSRPNTIKDWGCLMTCLTMVVNGYGYSETPKTFNDKMRAVGGALFKRVPDQTPFKTLEKSNADAKLGQYSQWLHVQDSTGTQGYVAAWYVKD